jgi:hypothetical protein
METNEGNESNKTKNPYALNPSYQTKSTQKPTKQMKARKLIIHMDSIQVIKLRIRGTNEGNERKETNNPYGLDPSYQTKNTRNK